MRYHEVPQTVSYGTKWYHVKKVVNGVKTEASACGERPGPGPGPDPDRRHADLHGTWIRSGDDPGNRHAGESVEARALRARGKQGADAGHVRGPARAAYAPSGGVSGTSRHGEPGVGAAPVRDDPAEGAH